MLNVIRDVLGIGVLAVLAYPFLLKHIQFFNIGNDWYVYLLSFIFLDFASYWTHRIAHTINYFWNKTIVIEGHNVESLWPFYFSFHLGNESITSL